MKHGVGMEMGYQVLSVLALGGVFGFLRVSSRDSSWLPRPYSVGVLAGLLVATQDITQRGSAPWWLIPVWVVLGVYSGGAVALAGGALGNLLGGLYRANRPRHLSRRGLRRRDPSTPDLGRTPRTNR